MAGLGMDPRHLTDNDIQRIGERTRRSILQLIKVEKGIICFCEHTKFLLIFHEHGVVQKKQWTKKRMI